MRSPLAALTGVQTAGHRLATKVASMTGWKRQVLAVVLGAIAALGFAPYHFLLAPFLSFMLLIWLLDGCRMPRSAFATGWSFGFGQFLAGLYWVTQGIVVFSDQLFWFVPIVLIILPGGLALFPATAIALYKWIIRKYGVSRVASLIIFALLWVAAEWLRGHVLSGFPWNLMATIWGDSPGVLQTVSLVGAYGLSLLTVFWLIILSSLIDPTPAPDHRRARIGQAAMAVIMAMLSFVALGLWGGHRLAMATVSFVPDVQIRILQPNIPQQDKWARDKREANLQLHLTMQTAPGQTAPGQTASNAAPITHVIWPETSASFFLDRSPRELSLIAKATPAKGLTLVGTPRRSGGGDGGDQIQLWNSLQAVDEGGEIVATYDKTHLVPLGEYVPLRGILPFAKAVYGETDYSAGSGPVTLHLPGLPPVSPLICYESIFPGAVVNRQDPAAWLLNITNDAWFGTSTGPYQHLLAARLRAIEEGLPLIRSAASGISAVIDPWGRILTSLPLVTRGSIDTGLPQPAPPTIYARFADRSLLALFVGFALLASVTEIRTRRRMKAL